MDNGRKTYEQIKDWHNSQLEQEATENVKAPAFYILVQESNSQLQPKN